MNIENLAKCLYHWPDTCHFMIVAKNFLLSDIEIKH